MIKEAKIRLRQLRVDEVKGFRDALKYDPIMYGCEKNDFTGVFLYAIENMAGDQVGYVGLAKYERRTLCICYLYINVNERLKGYAKATIKYLIEKNKDNNKYIYGTVASKNEKALKFYGKYYKFLGKDRHSLLLWNKDSEELLFKNVDGDFEVIFYYGY